MDDEFLENCRTFPSRTLAYAIKKRNWSIADCARETGLPEETIGGIIAHKARITPEVAEAFERVDIERARTLLSMQVNMDSAMLYQRLQAKGINPGSPGHPYILPPAKRLT